jgi:Na+/H+ antiporter NhaC
MRKNSLFLEGDIMGHSKNERVEFYGGELISLLPTIIYIFVAMILSLKFGFLSIENVTVGGMIGILIGFLLSKNKNIYWKTVMSGITKPGKARLLFIFALIGCFTKLLVCGEIGNGLVWISQIFNLSGGAFVLFVFISSMVIAVGSGAPIAALFAVVPLFYPPGVILGANPPVLIGAIISGIFFGDNLAPSSQVTVTTASTQTSKYTDDSVNTVTVISDRMKYILIAALISAVLFFINGGGGSLSHSAEAIGQFSNPRGLIMLIPLSVLLIICIKTKNLFKGLSYAINYRAGL